MKFVFPYKLDFTLSGHQEGVQVHHGAEFLCVRIGPNGIGWELVVRADTSEPFEESTIHLVEDQEIAEFTAEVVYLNSVGKVHFFAEVRP